MSEVSASTPSAAPPGGALEPKQYRLSDDLARLCLPQEFKDSYRKLAWVDSICFLFLVVGLIGLKAPKVVEHPLSEPVEVVQVEFVPPPEPPKTPPQVQPDEPPPDDSQSTPQDTPQVVQVVAAANSADVAFAVPVQGAVAIAREARFATPPPPVTHAAPATPVRFNPNAGDGGTYPKPDYPSISLRNHEEGTVTIELLVDTSGKITSAKVQKSSGFPSLDEAALKVVQRNWRFPPGKIRWLYWPCVFRMQ
jgi:periplasmic protein TonB